MNMQIYDYVVRDLIKANAFYSVNGTPNKRLMRIKEYAYYICKRMSCEQENDILKKIKQQKEK